MFCKENINFLLLILAFTFLQIHFSPFRRLCITKLSYVTLKVEISYWVFLLLLCFFFFIKELCFEKGHFLFETKFTLEGIWKHPLFVESSSETTCDEEISHLQAQRTQSASIASFHLPIWRGLNISWNYSCIWKDFWTTKIYYISMASSMLQGSFPTCRCAVQKERAFTNMLAPAF